MQFISGNSEYNNYLETLFLWWNLKDKEDRINIVLNKFPDYKKFIETHELTMCFGPIINDDKKEYEEVLGLDTKFNLYKKTYKRRNKFIRMFKDEYYETEELVGYFVYFDKLNTVFTNIEDKEILQFYRDIKSLHMKKDIYGR